MPPQQVWPEWWDWEFEYTYHILKRMVDRRFSQTDLRIMFQDAVGYRMDEEPGRWVILTNWNGHKWEIIVEPDKQLRCLVLVTAYMVE